MSDDSDDKPNGHNTASTPIAEPAVATSEVMVGLPGWCAGFRYVARTNRTVVLVKLPVFVLARALGLGPIDPRQRDQCVQFECDADTDNTRALLAGLQRCLDESTRILLDVH